MIDEKQIEELTKNWSENAKKDRLYIAIRLNDAAGIERLKAEGAVLSEYIKAMLKNGCGNIIKPNEYENDWYIFCGGLTKYSPEEFVQVIRDLRAELDGPIFYSDIVGVYIRDFYRPEVFGCVLDCFDSRKINKKQMLLYIIDSNMTELLEIAAEHGWIKYAKKCDEYIEYAQNNGKVECVAWLLDYKNRTFDLAREREKAEKRQRAELNAAPDSVMMMKKLWNYQKVDKDGAVTITLRHYKGDRTEIVIPAKIGKNKVTRVEVDVFNSGTPRKSFVSGELQSAVTKIVLPDGLESVGSGVYYEFEGLRGINIPDGVSSIGKHTFYNCIKLKNLTLPDSVKEIGAGAFGRCLELEEINIPRGITKIDDYVFEACEKLKAVKIPECVQSIGVGAFYNCKSIESVIIPNGVTEISADTFGGCKKLTRVELPDTIVKVDKYAFAGCSSLKEIVIPEGVREIGYAAFGQCAALEKVVLPASLEKAKNYTQRGITPRTIFFESPNVTAVVTPKSYAEKYCRCFDIPYVYKEN